MRRATTLLPAGLLAAVVHRPRVPVGLLRVDLLGLAVLRLDVWGLGGVAAGGGSLSVCLLPAGRAAVGGVRTPGRHERAAGRTGALGANSAGRGAGEDGVRVGAAVLVPGPTTAKTGSAGDEVGHPRQRPAAHRTDPRGPRSHTHSRHITPDKQPHHPDPPDAAQHRGGAAAPDQQPHRTRTLTTPHTRSRNTTGSRRYPGRVRYDSAYDPCWTGRCATTGLLEPPAVLQSWRTPHTRSSSRQPAVLPGRLNIVALYGS